MTGRKEEPAAQGSSWTEDLTDGATRLRLSDPYEWGGQTVDSLVVKKLRAKAMRVLPTTEPTIDDFLKVAEILCGVTASELDMLGVEDTTRLLEVIGAGFGGGPGGGET